MITYIELVNDIKAEQLHGFFVGWPSPPSPETHLKLLQNSDHVVLALDDTSGKVVGFITAVSDGVLSAYIPLLEVLPEYQGQGIGKTITKMMLDKLSDLYMVDIVCDLDIVPFYARFGMVSGTAMMIRIEL